MATEFDREAAAAQLAHGFLGDSAREALAPLKSAMADSIFPFLEAWWDQGDIQPSSGDRKKVMQQIRAPDHQARAVGYEWIDEFFERISSAIKFNRRNFINIHPSPYLPALAASFAVSAQNPNNIVPEVSEATWQMERECVEWMAKHLTAMDPCRAWGNVVSCGTVGNMTALLVARDYTYHKLARPRTDEVGARGVIGRKPGIVLTSAGAHYSLKKSLWFLGIGHENLIRVPVAWDEALERDSARDDRFLRGIRDGEWPDLIHDSRQHERAKGELERFYQGEQRPFELQPLNSEVFKHLYSCFQFDVPLLAFVVNAGTTFTGTLEQMDSTAIRRLRAEDVHIHVDAAWGGFALVCPELRERVAALEKADSVVIDGHKLGFLAYPCAAVIFRDLDSRYQIEHDAPYLRHLAPTLEGSRPGSHVAGLWAALRGIGEDGYVRWIRQLLAVTRRVASALESSGDFQVLHRVDLNALAFAPIPHSGESRERVNNMCAKLKESIKKHGFLINLVDSVSGIQVQNEPGATKPNEKIVDLWALRLVITNPRVDPHDADVLVEALSSELKVVRAES